MDRVEKTKVTIIVPVYNAEKYLDECIASCRSQTYSNLEILLIDDGSTDQSGRICDIWAEKDARIQVFHKKNGGVSSARNLGIEKATGAYLIFVDSDDCIHLKMVETYLKNRDSDSVYLCIITENKKDLEVIDETKRESSLKQYDRKHFMSLYRDEHVNSPCDKLYNADIIRQKGIRFDETMSLGEDMMFNLEYFKYAPPVYQVIQLPLYYYRQEHGESLVNSYRPELFPLQQYMLKSLKLFLQESGSWDKEGQDLYYQLAWSRLYLTVQIYQSYLKKGKKECRGIVKTSLQDPFWKEIEWECWKRGLMNWKSILKKAHMELLKIG